MERFFKNPVVCFAPDRKGIEPLKIPYTGRFGHI